MWAMLLSGSCRVFVRLFTLQSPSSGGAAAVSPATGSAWPGGVGFSVPLLLRSLVSSGAELSLRC